MTRPRLLLIDDEPALAAFVANAATMCGFEPVETGDDQEFREQFHADRPGLVALDLGMPGMDGVQLLRFLADEDFTGPVLIISGFDRRVLESAFRLGEALGLNMIASSSLSRAGFSIGPIMLRPSASPRRKALGLNMIGPIEKPARLNELEAILRQHRPAPAP